MENVVQIELNKYLENGKTIFAYVIITFAGRIRDGVESVSVKAIGWWFQSCSACTS